MFLSCRLSQKCSIIYIFPAFYFITSGISCPINKLIIFTVLLFPVITFGYNVMH